ncbi:RNA polymerase sigma factor [Chloroflexi bacterium TSY]|nr:RNA polymerase sigma factor [Chloroflexi bacterium TSY]
MTITRIDRFHLQEILATERPRLLGLCRYRLGDPDDAEDVVQEVLLEAWRSIEKLRNPEALDRWLNGIARNVCARWQQGHGRSSFIMQNDEHSDAALDMALDDFDLEVELEQHELALLLDRALALLPATTREVLIGKYIAESPYAEIADELGLSENVVAVRLHRGKIALRKLLATDLRSEAETFGLIPTDDVWKETRIWCTECGRKRLMGRLDDEEFALRCPDCHVEKHSYYAQNNVTHYGTLKTFRPALNRFFQEMHTFYMQTIQACGLACPCCGDWLVLHKNLPCFVPLSIRKKRGLHIYCPRCRFVTYATIDKLALYHQVGRDFWRRERRIRTLPHLEIETGGLAALHIPYESVKNGATLDLIVRRDTYELLAIHTSATS